MLCSSLNISGYLITPSIYIPACKAFSDRSRWVLLPCRARRMCPLQKGKGPAFQPLRSRRHLDHACRCNVGSDLLVSRRLSRNPFPYLLSAHLTPGISGTQDNAPDNLQVKQKILPHGCVSDMHAHVSPPALIACVHGDFTDPIILPLLLDLAGLQDQIYPIKDLSNPLL